MGCGIHLHVEIKVNGTWHHYNHPKVDRWYHLFAKMANVRNYDEYGPIEPISLPKGFPEDASFTTKFDYEKWGGDAHSASWLSSEEIKQLSDWYYTQTKSKNKDNFDGFEASDMFGYLFGNSFAGFIAYPSSRPEGLEDVRFVFWFDG